MDKHYSKMELGTWGTDLKAKGRVMAGEALGLTGCEISFNYTPAGKFVPFVHAHRLNEEVYIVISGKGKFMVNDEEFAIEEGSVIRVAPDGQRAIAAGEEDLIYACIQVEAGSLTAATHDDGIISDTIKASWM
jgi:uncharacterized cupin superfamily protein